MFSVLMDQLGLLKCKSSAPLSLCSEIISIRMGYCKVQVSVGLCAYACACTGVADCLVRLYVNNCMRVEESIIIIFDAYEIKLFFNHVT